MTSTFPSGRRAPAAMHPTPPSPSAGGWAGRAMAGTLAAGTMIGVAHATEIRTHAGNPVPQCVTPERLMAFMAERNPRLDPRYRTLATLYKTHGEAYRVRWDYAFFQMALETNFLAFRRADGSSGDVKPAQNNFAGLGTTGGGVPGDSYPNISTGVLAQIQHLVAYSGERLPKPVGPRTQLKQDDIVAASLKLRRPVRFADLARRWAVDPKYGRSIEWVADRFREAHCAQRASADAASATSTRPLPDVVRGETDPRDGRTALGGEPALERTAPAVASPSKAAGSSQRGPAAVRTVWTQAPSGDAGPPRRVAAVAGDAASPPATTDIRPLAPNAADKPLAVVPAPPNSPDGRPAEQAAGPAPVSPLPPSSEASGGRTAAAKTAILPLAVPIAIAAERPAATIALSAAAAPFAGGRIIGESKGAHGSCRIVMASYGGSRTVLIRSVSKVAVELVVLSVAPGFEATSGDNYIRTRAPGAVLDGQFANRDAALERAREICPGVT